MAEAKDKIDELIEYRHRMKELLKTIVLFAGILAGFYAVSYWMPPHPPAQLSAMMALMAMTYVIIRQFIWLVVALAANMALIPLFLLPQKSSPMSAVLHNHEQPIM